MTVIPKRLARELARKMAASSYDFLDGNIVAIDDPRAIRALERAFEKTIRSGDLALMSLRPEDAKAFPSCSRSTARGRAWLATCVDGEGHGCFGLQIAQTPADEGMAQAIALSRVAVTASSVGFPMGPARGRA